MKITEKQEWVLTKARDLKSFWYLGPIQELTREQLHTQWALNSFSLQITTAWLFFGSYKGEFNISLSDKDWELVRQRAIYFLLDEEKLEGGQRDKKLRQEFFDLIEDLWKDSRENIED